MTSCMEHGADQEERLRAFASFGTTLGGHIAVMNLLKRHDLLSRKVLPESVEAEWTDRYAVLWDRVSRVALGYPRELQAASKVELWRMAQSLVAGIDTRPARCDGYPEGWETIAAIVRSGIPVTERGTPVEPRKLPRIDARAQALTTLNYVACELDWPESKVLEKARKTRGKLGAGDVGPLMAVYSGEMERRAGSGPPEILFEEPREYENREPRPDHDIGGSETGGPSEERARGEH